MAQGRNPLPRAHTTDTAEKGPAVAAALSPAVTRFICREVKDNAIQRKELRFPLRTSDVVNLQACFPLLPAPVHGSPNTQGLLWAKRPQPLTARSTHLQSSIPRLPVSPWAAGPGCPQRGQSRAPQSCPVWMGCRTDPVASVHLKPHSFLLFISSTIHGPSVSS